MEQDKLNDRNNWDRFVLQQSGSFLQSFEWGEFQRSIGREVFYLKEASFQALVIKYQMPLGRNYLYCPQGPVLEKSEIRNPKSETNTNFQISNFQNRIRDLAKQEKSVFVRIEPMADIGRAVLEELSLEKSKDIQPRKTLVLDLNLSEEELLAQMHEKTRYNIGLAQRKGVGVRITNYSDDDNNKNDYNNDFEAFWDLLSQTAKRQGIRLHGREYYQKELNPSQPSFKKEGEKNFPQPLFVKEESSSLCKREVGRDFRNILFFAEYHGKVIAANMVNIFGNRATYVHGGSDNGYRSLMAPHLLQWEQVKFAKSAGCKIYDFWGYDEEKWPGVSRFKKGFGGRGVERCGTHDYVLDKFWYGIYKAGRRILR